MYLMNKNEIIYVKDLKKMLKKYKKKDLVILSIPCFNEEGAEATLSVSLKNDKKRDILMVNSEIW